MIDITNEVKHSILQQKLTLWRNTHYDAELDAEIAQTLNDEEMLAGVKARLKRALQAIKFLEKKLAEMNQNK